MREKVVIFFVLLIKSILKTEGSVQDRIRMLGGGKNNSTASSTDSMAALGIPKRTNKAPEKDNKIHADSKKLQKDKKNLNANLNKLTAYIEGKDEEEIAESIVEEYFDWSVGIKTAKDKYLAMLSIIEAKYPNLLAGIIHSDYMIKLNSIKGVIPQEMYFTGEIYTKTNTHKMEKGNAEKEIHPIFNSAMRLPADTSDVLVTPYTKMRKFTTNLNSKGVLESLNEMKSGGKSEQKKLSPIIVPQYRTRTNNKIFDLTVKDYRLVRKEDSSLGEIVRQKVDGNELIARRRTIRKFQVVVSNMIYWSIASMMVTVVQEKEKSDEAQKFLENLKGTPEEVVLFLISSKNPGLKSVKYLAANLSKENVREGYIIWLIRLRASILYLSKSKGDPINIICKNSSRKKDVQVECLEKILTGATEKCYSNQIVDLDIKNLSQSMTLCGPRRIELDPHDVEEDLKEMAKISTNSTELDKDISLQKLIHILEHKESVKKVAEVLIEDAQSEKKDPPLWWKDGKEEKACDTESDENKPLDLYLDHYYNLDTNENNLYWSYKERTFTVHIDMGNVLVGDLSTTGIVDLLCMKKSQMAEKFIKEIEVHTSTIDTLKIVERKDSVEFGSSTVPTHVKIDYIINFFLKNFPGFKKVILADMYLDFFPRSLLSTQNTKITHLKFEKVVYIGSLVSSIMGYSRDKIILGKNSLDINIYSEEFIRKYLTEMYSSASMIDPSKKELCKEELNIENVLQVVLKKINATEKPSRNNVMISVNRSGGIIHKYWAFITGEKQENSDISILIENYKFAYAKILRLKRILEDVEEFRNYAAILNHLTPEAIYESIVLNSPVLKNICISSSVIPYTQKAFNLEERIVTSTMTGLVENRMQKTETAIEKIIIKGHIMDSIDFLSRIDNTKMYSVHFVITSLADLYAVRYITSINSEEDISFACEAIHILENAVARMTEDLQASSTENREQEKAEIEKIKEMIARIKKSDAKKEIDREFNFGLARTSYMEKIMTNIKKTRLRELEKRTKVIGVSLTDINLTKTHKQMENPTRNPVFPEGMETHPIFPIITGLLDSVYFPSYNVEIPKREAEISKSLNEEFLELVVKSEFAKLLEYLKTTQGSIEASYNIIHSIYQENIELILTKSFTILEKDGLPGATCRIFSSGLNSGVVRINVYNATSNVEDPELAGLENILYFEAALNIFHAASLSLESIEGRKEYLRKYSETAQPMIPVDSTDLECKLVTPISMVVVTFASNVVGLGAAMQKNNEGRHGLESQSQTIHRFRSLWANNPPIILGVVPYSLLPYFAISGGLVANEVEFLLSCGFTQVMMPEPGRYKEKIGLCCYEKLSSLGYTCRETEKLWIYKRGPNFQYKSVDSPEIREEECVKSRDVPIYGSESEKEVIIWSKTAFHASLNTLIILKDNSLLLTRNSDLKEIRDMKFNLDIKGEKEKAIDISIRTLIYMYMHIQCAKGKEFQDKMQEVYPELKYIQKNRMVPGLEDRYREESIQKGHEHKIHNLENERKTPQNTFCAIYHIDYLLCTPCTYSLVESDCNIRSNRKERDKIIKTHLRIIISKAAEREKSKNPEADEKYGRLTRSTYFKLLKFMEAERKSQLLAKLSYPILLAYKFLTVDYIKEKNGEVCFLNPMEKLDESSPLTHTKESYAMRKKKNNMYMKQVIDMHYKCLDDEHLKFKRLIEDPSYPIFIQYKKQEGKEAKPTSSNNGADFLNYSLPLVPYQKVDICFNEYSKKDLESANIKITKREDKRYQEIDTKKCSFLDPAEKQIELFAPVSHLKISEMEAILLNATDFKFIYDKLYSRGIHPWHASTKTTGISLCTEESYLLMSKTSSLSSINYKASMFDTPEHKSVSMFIEYGEFVHSFSNTTVNPEQKHFIIRVGFIKHEI